MSHVLELANAFGIDAEVVNLRSPRPSFGDGLALYKVRFSLELARRCRAAFDPHRFDVVHLNCSFRRWSALRDQLLVAMAQRRGLPVVVQLHGGLAGGREWIRYPRPARAAYRRLLEKADAVIVLADEVARDLAAADLRPRRLEMVPNFLPPSWGGDEEPMPEPCDVLYLGRLMRAKGLETLRAVAARLPQRSFRWVGRPHETLAVPDNVEWLPEAGAAALAAQLRACRVFLFPSHSEGFPNAVLEAMAAGRPVVASPRGAMPEMLDPPWGGFLHEPDDVEGMVRSLEELLTDPALRERMGERNRERVRAEYTAERVLPRLRAVYAEVARRRERSGGAD